MQLKGAKEGEEPLKKSLVSQMVKKFPTIYRTQMIMSTYTTACHLALSRARQIEVTQKAAKTVKAILQAEFRYF
jgi:hypothetical protein